MIALGLDRVESGLKGCMVWLSKFIVGEAKRNHNCPFILHLSSASRLSLVPGGDLNAGKSDLAAT